MPHGPVAARSATVTVTGFDPVTSEMRDQEPSDPAATAAAVHEVVSEFEAAPPAVSRVSST
jgi:hypothetical protein